MPRGGDWERRITKFVLKMESSSSDAIVEVVRVVSVISSTESEGREWRHYLSVR